jgi:signal transduction histidine kinase
VSKSLPKTQSGSFLARLIGAGGDKPQLQTEKARLEAFLDAFPGEYCGFAKDGSLAYSRGFCALLGQENIRALPDILSRLSPPDAQLLESLFSRLKNTGIRFVQTFKSSDETRTFKISGSRGHDLNGQDSYHVLWLEDISEEITAREKVSAEKDVKDSELSQVQVALNSIPRPLWLRDINQKIVWCNTTYAKYVNMNVAQVIAEQKELATQARKKKNPEEDELQPGPSLAALAIKQGKAVDTRAHGILEGNRILMRISEIPITPLNMTLGIAFNITREEELETELQRYKSSNQELLGQLRSAIAIYAADETLEFYNSAFGQLWGLEDQWLNTRPKLGEIMEKLRETRRLPEQADFRRFKSSWLAMFTGLIDPYEDMLYLPDGTALRMLVVPHSMGGLMMTFEDVTSRLELESSYNTLIAVQKETLDNLGEAVAAYGGDGRLKLWNPAFARLWDLNPEDLEGEPHITKIVEKKKKFFAKDSWTQRRDELIAKGLDRLMHDGRLSRDDESLVDYTTVPLPDGGVLITYSDVTDTVRVENALREKNAALEAAEQLKLDFLANVSYQLRTPLNAMMGFTEILEQEYFGPLNERQKEYIGNMKEANERLLGLINDILDLSTLEAGYMSLEREDVKIYDMMHNVYALVNEWARKEEVEVTLNCPKNIGKITADERRLQQAIINLIRNAINFTPPGGRIEMSASRKKDGLSISVSDTGIGISKEDSARIFEPFERAQSGSSQARLSRQGAGLGLSLVKNIVALHGGEVTLESSPGKGTTVNLFLPFTSMKTNLKLPIAPQKLSA